MPQTGGTIKFPVLTVDSWAEAGLNRWFRLKHWNSTNFLMMQTDCPTGWEVFFKDESVAGVTFENREKAFFSICRDPDFKVYLEREEDNREDTNAIRVMGRSSRAPQGLHLGYLEKGTAKCLAGATALDARPHSVWLPQPECNFGWKVSVLIPRKVKPTRTKREPEPPPIPEG
jgi:hypothetical protein